MCPLHASLEAYVFGRLHIEVVEADSNPNGKTHGDSYYIIRNSIQMIRIIESDQM